MLATINSFYLAATTIGSNVNGSEAIVAWFNNQLYHTAPLSLNLVHNAIVRAALGPDHSIRVINNPLPFTLESRQEIVSIEASQNVGFQLASNLSFAMAFVAAFYVLFYIKVNLRYMVSYFYIGNKMSTLFVYISFSIYILNGVQ